MQEQLLLGIDIGTTGTKGILTDSAGTVLNSAYCGYETSSSQAFYAEQNAEEWYEAVIFVIHECVKDLEDPSRVAAIGFSSQGGSLVVTDKEGTPLRPAIVWLDGRGEQQHAWFQKQLPQDYFYKTTGWSLGNGLNANYIQWLRDNERSTFEKGAYFLSAIDFIIMRLTGKPVIDPSSAGITNLFNINTMRYDDKILNLLDLSEDRLAGIQLSGTCAGKLKSEAAEQTGLAVGTPVVAGGHDQYCVAVGAGALDNGDCILATGTAWVVLYVGSSLCYDNNATFSQSIHPVAGKYGSIASISSGGVCLEWLRNSVLTSDGQKMTFAELDEGAADILPGADGLYFYPYFTGSPSPRANAAAKGAFVGLDLAHNRFHMARAVMEAIGYQVNWILEAKERLSGGHPDAQLHMLGGASRSRLWTQIIADITGKSVVIPGVSDTACMGAAILAGCGVGLFGSPSSGYQSFAQRYSTVMPNAQTHELYQKGFETFKRNAEAVISLEWSERHE